MHPGGGAAGVWHVVLRSKGSAAFLEGRDLSVPSRGAKRYCVRRAWARARVIQTDEVTTCQANRNGNLTWGGRSRPCVAAECGRDAQLDG